MAKSPARVEPQKSEVHETTDDAESGPVAAGGEVQRGAAKPAMPHGDIRPTSVTLSDATIVRDDTDVGGPLVIQSDDPDLNPPRVPAPEFPTDGTPEFDPPVEK